VLFIGGTKGRPRVVDSGVFFCPNEGGDRPYTHIVMKRTATVFFVPVADIGELGEYVECQSCGGTYELAVLDLASEAEVQDTPSRGLQRLAAAVIAADGFATTDERFAVLDMLNEHWGVTYTEAELDRDLRAGTEDLYLVLENAGSVMNLDGREGMMQAAVYFRPPISP